MKIDSSHMKYILISDVDGISKRTVRCLNRENVYTIKDLVDYYDSKEKLACIPGLGATSLSEIEQSIPKIYPGFLGINPCSSIDEVETHCFDLLSKLEQTIDELKRRNEILERQILSSEEMNDKLFRELRSERELTLSLRQRLKARAES